MRTSRHWLPTILRCGVGAAQLLRGARFEVQGVAIRGTP
jgi:hypothetical protein